MTKATFSVFVLLVFFWPNEGISISPSHKIRKIALMIAMQEEAKPIIAHLHLSLDDGLDKALPMKVYKGKVRGAKIILVLNGHDKTFGVDNVATQPASIATLLTIKKFNPDLIINAGTAGGFHRKGAKIGDVYVSSGSFKYYDRRIPIPGFSEYGRGDYPSLDVSKLAEDLKLKSGIVSTGNSLDMTERDLKLIRQNNATIKDMEATTVAWVAHYYEVPMFAVKSITDLLDIKKPTQEEFLKNLSLAASNLQQKLTEIINYCAGNSVQALSKRH